MDRATVGLNGEHGMRPWRTRALDTRASLSNMSTLLRVVAIGSVQKDIHNRKSENSPYTSTIRT